MKTYQQTKSLEYVPSLISLKELAEKIKDGEVVDEKVKCKYSKFVFVGLYQSL